jgi:hypothetical protein
MKKVRILCTRQKSLILVEVALVAVQDKQSVRPLLTRLCMLVKVLQPPKLECVVSLAVVKDRELLIVRYVSLLVLGKDVYAPFVDYKG